MSVQCVTDDCWGNNNKGIRLRIWIAIPCQKVITFHGSNANVERDYYAKGENGLEFTVSINPCSECYINTFIKGTTLTLFFSEILQVLRTLLGPSTQM